MFISALLFLYVKITILFFLLNGKLKSLSFSSKFSFPIIDHKLSPDVPEELICYLPFFCRKLWYCYPWISPKWYKNWVSLSRPKSEFLAKLLCFCSSQGSLTCLAVVGNKSTYSVQQVSPQPNPRFLYSGSPLAKDCWKGTYLTRISWEQSAILYFKVM